MIWGFAVKILPLVSFRSKLSDFRMCSTKKHGDKHFLLERICLLILHNFVRGLRNFEFWCVEFENFLSMVRIEIRDSLWTWLPREQKVIFYVWTDFRASSHRVTLQNIGVVQNNTSLRRYSFSWSVRPWYSFYCTQPFLTHKCHGLMPWKAFCTDIKNVAWLLG